FATLELALHGKNRATSRLDGKKHDEDASNKSMNLSTQKVIEFSALFYAQWNMA
ncbi:hypothetical protein ACLOJK_037547, partial [Asimina triloba]